MKIPHNLDAADLVRALRVLGYERVRQGGWHIRLTVGALVDGVLKSAAAHHNPTVEMLLARLGF